MYSWHCTVCLTWTLSYTGNDDHTSESVCTFYARSHALCMRNSCSMRFVHRTWVLYVQNIRFVHKTYIKHTFSAQNMSSTCTEHKLHIENRFPGVMITLQ